ncbi:CHORD domain-containing protein [Cephalotus follicularis]|uniref:CHORD domain-containing protein n=1 Tax=Cephalotus follicularis TaxID=3775 RepID=A0A1Q3B1L6_CEPFO|nr:CHORD domain-containing protein [Cephalotus follicularis]
MKEWGCCKKRSHDFNLFLDIPGCKTGKHTSEKPIVTNFVSSKKLIFAPTACSTTTHASSKESCPRCQQGFYCSDHGSQAKELKLNLINFPSAEPAESNVDVKVCSAPVKKVVDINQPQTCKNPGCGQTFKEKDNHEAACSHHPGPPVFHDRMRGWKCCNIHVKEFDEFMTIPPCTKGWHNADP